MTREELDAIRERLVASKTLRSFTGSVNDMIFGQRAMRDVEALLAEVERLTAEVEAKTTQSVALIGQNGRLQQEVERLTADPLPAAAWVREVERAAFRRGVAAMREVAAVKCALSPLFDEPICRLFAAIIRDLPDPEDKS